MSKKSLFILWAAGFALCAGLGFIPNPTGLLKGLLAAVAVISFLPPLLLIRQGGRHTLRLVRNLAALWLVLTVLLIIGNFLSVAASPAVGNVLYCLLVMVSSPMVCGQYWVIGLFGWAYLLLDSMNELKKA